MEEYKIKQLLEQEGKLIDAFASGNIELVEREFNAIESFILNKEQNFLDGIKDERLKRESKMDKAKKEYAESIRKAAEIVDDEELILNSFKCFEALQSIEKEILSRYPYDLVESVSSYARNVNGNK